MHRLLQHVTVCVCILRWKMAPSWGLFMGRNSHLLPFSARGCQLPVRGQRGGRTAVSQRHHTRTHSANLQTSSCFSSCSFSSQLALILVMSVALRVKNDFVFAQTDCLCDQALLKLLLLLYLRLLRKIFNFAYIIRPSLFVG